MEDGPAPHLLKLYFLVRLVWSLSHFCHVRYAPYFQPLNVLAFLVQVFLVLDEPELLVPGPRGVLFLQPAVLLQEHSHPRIIRETNESTGYSCVLLQLLSSFRQI